jgi:hypothetical protein
VERFLRDCRVNTIFEGSSEIMRLFIARETVDTHLDVAGDLIDPKVPARRKLAALGRAALFYSRWYPRLYLGWGRWPRYAEFGPLATHLRFVNRMSRKLARTIFHCMVRFGPRLEKRQAVLGRLVEIGAELLAITAACARARALAARHTGTDADRGRSAVELADVFARQSRRRVREKFRTVFVNDDLVTYAAAQRVLRGEHLWLESGVVGNLG